LLAGSGVPLARALVVLDTLHPIPEGRGFRWRIDVAEAVEVLDYGRANEGEAAENQSSRNRMRRRLASIGRYALRGIGRPQELLTREPALEMS
jgi:hypothetical protein